jgi:hypothetical protein
MKAEKKQRKQARAITRLQDQLADMTAQRNEVVEEKEKALKQVKELEDDVESDEDLIDMLTKHRNEAWDQRNQMRDRVLELEASNANLCEAYYAMYHGVDPYVPPGPAGVQPRAIVADADEESNIHPNSSHAFFTDEDAFTDEPVIDEPMEDDD